MHNLDYIIGYDLETRPRPELVERFASPFPDFDESAVKYGNTKDPQKRQELLAMKRSDHEQARTDYWAKLKERAALDPLTAEIQAIGLIATNGHEIITGSEREILETFWTRYDDTSSNCRFVSWSGSGTTAANFDMDFAVTRSRILGLDLPATLRDRGRYSTRVVDLTAEFLLGRREAYLSLSRAADVFGLYDDVALGLTRKTDNDPVTGENWWKWFNGLMSESGLTPEQQREKAEGYLLNDIKHLLPLAQRIL